MESLGRDIRLEVLEQDALEAAVDVLVLKHAQDMYGLDKKVVEAIGMDPSLLPPLDGYRTWRGFDAIAAQTVIFVGVPTLREFDYAAIRKFAEKALCAVASDVSTAREIGLTLHGAGYGLDEVEAFQAELAGLLDAAATGDLPRGLERICFLEVNPGRAKRVSEVLADILPGQVIWPGVSLEQAVEDTPSERLKTVGLDSGAKGHALVAMPFAQEFEDNFHYGISSAVRAAGLICERIDKQAFTGDVMLRLKERISSAALVVADLTNAKPNVFLEVGFAWGRDVPTVLLCKKGTDLEFDVQGQKCLFYETIQELEKALTAELKALAP